jgi:hypothetical protein
MAQLERSRFHRRSPIRHSATAGGILPTSPGRKGSASLRLPLLRRRSADTCAKCSRDEWNGRASRCNIFE